MAFPADEAQPDRRATERGLLRKLHSLSGVLPLGAFLLFHVWQTSSIGGSTEIYDRQLGFLHGGPFLGFLELVLVVAPLLYHAGYGVLRSFQPREPSHAYDTDVMLTLQRACGIVVLLFVGIHVWEFRVQTWTHGLPVASYSTKLVAHLSSTQWGVPFVALGYLVGIAATVFHLVNGMTSFSTTWGLTPTFAARHRARLFFRAIGLLLFAVSAALVIQLATGSRLFPDETRRSGVQACGSSAASPQAPPHAHATSAPSTAPGALPGRDR